MGRAPCCDKANVKKGPWSPEEDAKLKEYIDKYGTGGNWIALPQKAGLRRCGKSCRLRWLNYLRPNIKHGEFSDDEDRIICTLFANIGSRWSIIAAQLPGRTDNDIKNYWNTKLKKKLMGMVSSSQRKSLQSSFTSLLHQTISSSSSSYKCSNNSNYYSSGLEPIPVSSSSSLLSPNSFTTSTTGSILQPQESLLGAAQHYQVKDSLLMFGGDQASCSSSDGSCNNNNPISTHGKELDQYEYGGTGGSASNGDHHHQQICSQNYFCNGGTTGGENHKFLLSNGAVYGTNGLGEKHNAGLWGEIPLIDYGLEEIKQLMSSTTASSCTNFLFDENKTEEMVMYY